ncbi:MAG: putative aminoacrylate peracid reductase RutC [Gemmatimonadaceae bacterium]|nr:putative aminoacrylate peracid reductase RutC [Gemmatimonadaceae bacterium]
MTHPAVERIGIGPGVTISRILTGLWQIADMERNDRSINLAETAGAMQPYVNAGFTTFDMADHYGSAEDVAGAFVSGGVRDRVQLCTKWVPKPGPVTRDRVRSAVQRSLDRLRTDRIDLMQFHAWRFADPSWLDAMFYLQELRDEGTIGALGTTNFDTAHLRVAVASGIGIATNQVSYSLLDRRASGRMATFCQENGVQLLAYGTVAGGFLSDRWLDRPEPDWNKLDTWSQMKYGRFIAAAGGWNRFQTVLHALDAVASIHGVSMTNVATRYVLDRPAVGGIVIGARLGNREHIAENLQVFALRLTPEDLREIDTALDALFPIPGDCGDEYRKPPYLTASGDLSHHVEDFPAAFPVQLDDRGRRRAFSGTTWEARYGYSRAVRDGDRIFVSGTTASHGDRLIGGTDAAAQTHFVFDKIEAAIESLGGEWRDVVRTRVFVSDVSQWEAVAGVHGERLGQVQPANTLVQAPLIGPEYLVEIEAEAIVPERA